MLSVFFSVSWSFSAGVETIVSFKEFEPPPVCPKPLFGRSAVDSASGSCCGAVATTEEIWNKTYQIYENGLKLCWEQIKRLSKQSSGVYLTECRTSCVLASVLADRGNRSNWCSSSSRRWPPSCSWHTTASFLSHPRLVASPLLSASLPQTLTSLFPVPDFVSFLPL